jgi:hypothetical protein
MLTFVGFVWTAVAADVGLLCVSPLAVVEGEETGTVPLSRHALAH